MNALKKLLKVYVSDTDFMFFYDLQYLYRSTSMLY